MNGTITSEQTTDSANVEVQWYFAVPIFSVLLPDFACHRTSLIDLIQNKRNCCKGVNKTNRKGWHSHDDMHQWNHEAISWMCSTVGEFAGSCIRSLERGPDNFQLILKSAWANVNGAGCWNGPHHHLPHHWSAVLYIQTQDATAVQDGEDRDGAIEFINPIQLASCFGQPSGIGYRPQDGQVLLFHSALQHMVHPHFSGMERISVAFNFDILPV